MREVAAELALDGETTWQLTLATTEAFANALEHGLPCDPRGIFLRVESRGGRVAVEVRDCGGCFPGERPRSPKREGEGGRGILLIEAIMDHLDVAPENGTTSVRFGKRLAA